LPSFVGRATSRRASRGAANPRRQAASFELPRGSAASRTCPMPRDCWRQGWITPWLKRTSGPSRGSTHLGGNDLHWESWAGSTAPPSRRYALGRANLLAYVSSYEDECAGVGSRSMGAVLRRPLTTTIRPQGRREIAGAIKSAAAATWISRVDARSGRPPWGGLAGASSMPEGLRSFGVCASNERGRDEERRLTIHSRTDLTPPGGVVAIRRRRGAARPCRTCAVVPAAPYPDTLRFATRLLGAAHAA